MSLQVWLPLNKESSIKNQGLLGDLTITTNPTFIDKGKIGFKSMTSGSYKMSAEQSSKCLNGREFSLTCWIYIDSDSDDGYFRLFGNENSNSPGCYTIMLYHNLSRIYLTWKGYDPNRGEVLIGQTNTSESLIPTREWTHVVFTYTHKNNEALIYINGELRYTFILGERFTATGYNQETPLMESYSTVLKNDYRIYDHCLSPKEIKELSKGLVLHYPLHDLKWEEMKLPNNYTQLEYIDNNGTASIHLDYEMRPSIVDADFRLLEKPNALKILITQHIYGGLWVGVDPNGYIRTDNGYYSKINAVGADINLQVKWDAQGYLYCYVNGDYARFEPDYYKTEDISDARIQFFESIAGGYISNVRIYRCGVKSLDGNIISELIPCINNLGEIGVYDIVRKQFYGNSGTGSFTAGPVLKSFIALEIDKIYDCSGYKNNGNLVKNISYKEESSRYNSCLSINSINEFPIELNTPIALNLDITISYWVNFKDTTNNISLAVFELKDSINNRIINQGIDEGTRIQAGKSTPTYFYGYLFNNNLIFNNIWYFFTLVSKNDSEFDLYVNGVLINDRVNVKWNFKFPDSLGNLGKIYGNISDFRIYSTTLSEEDILEIYNTSAYIHSNGLNCYEFIEEGNSLINKSGIINTSEINESSDNTDIYKAKINTKQIIEI